jgi:GrpB-like predicted nucleotidyltransferase (UPF0157 family)
MSERKYTIEEYDPEWPEKFEEIKKKTGGIFGNKALYIEHVGSTSVPGLKSKPLIDVLIVVKDWEKFDIEKTLMANDGYQFQLDLLAPSSLLFFKIKNNEKSENIHVFAEGAEKINQFIYVRDYLRTHPERASEYEKLKDELVSKYPNDYIAYRQGKGDFLRETYELAKSHLNLQF